MSDNTQIAGLHNDFDDLHHLRSDFDENCVWHPYRQQARRQSRCAFAEPVPGLTVTLAGLAYQTYLLREALFKSPNGLKSNYDAVCETISMLEAYTQPEIPTMDHGHRFILSISDNIEASRAMYETMRSPETCKFSIVMKRLSKVCDRFLDGVFGGACQRRVGQGDALSQRKLKDDTPMVAKTGSEEDNARMAAFGAAQRLAKCTPRSENHLLKDDLLEPAEVLEHGVTYLKMILPENFTIPSRSAFVPTRTYLETSTLLLIPESAERSAADYILYLEDESPPSENSAPLIVEGEHTIWLKDAVESWWKRIGHVLRDPEAWTAFISSKRLLLLAAHEPVLSPCGNHLENDDCDASWNGLEYSGQKDRIAIPHYDHKMFDNRPYNTSASLEKGGRLSRKTFLPTGFMMPTQVEHAGKSTLSHSFEHNLSTGLSQEHLQKDVCRNLENRSRMIAATSTRSSEVKQALQDAIETWQASMDMDAQSMDDWCGFQDGDTHIVSESWSDAQVQPNMILSLRGGGSDIGSDPGNKHKRFSDDFERLYDGVLRQNAKVCGASAPSECTEAWMKLASLLQMRNSHLTHQVRKLQDMNDSFAEDVDWHVDALAKLEEELREAQIDRAAAWAEVLDLKDEFSRSWIHDAWHEPDLGNGPSTYADMAGSDYSELSMNCNPDIGTGIFHESQQRSEPTCGETVQHKPTLRQVHKVPQTGAVTRANAFYFCPRASLILLMTSPPKTYYFAAGSTLPQIHQSLIHRCHEDVQDDPMFQIRDILDMREHLGIQLPNPVRDEVVRIGLPDLHEISDLNNKVLLAAWEAVEVGSRPSNKCSQDWHKIVRPGSCPLLEHTYSGVCCEDADKVFGDLSWGRGGAGTVRLPDKYCQSA